MKISSKALTRHDFLGIAVWGMMCEAGNNQAEEIAKLFGITPGAPYEVTLKLTVNDVEMNFEDFMKTLKRQYNELIERDAKEQIRARVSTMLDNLTDILKNAEREAIWEVEDTFPGKKVF